MMMGNRIAPSVKFVRSLEGKYYLMREAAQILDINVRYLRNWNKNRVFEPSFFTHLGKVRIYLYTDGDIARIRKYLDDQKLAHPISQIADIKPSSTGRPSKWTPAQRKARQRKFSQVHYYKSQAQRHLDLGEPQRAEECMQKMRQAQQELREQDYEYTYRESKEINE